MFFSIACHTADYSDSKYIGVNYVTRDNGGCSFYGSTTSSYRNINNILTKKMFIKKTYEDYNQLGQIIAHSMKLTINYINKHKKSYSSNDRNEYVHKYNLLGDPSLFVRGIAPLEQLELKNNEEFHRGDEIKYTCSGTISQKSSFKMDVGSKVELEAKEKIILTSGFKAEKGAIFKAIINNN